MAYPSDIYQKGPLASRPAAAPQLAGVRYWDTDSNTIARCNGTAWENEPTGGAPSGSAGGSLTGSYPNPTLANNAVTTAKIADANVTTAKIADANVTLAKIQNVTDERLLGRSAGSAGAPQEIAIGSGLSLSGGTLSATGGGGGGGGLVGPLGQTLTSPPAASNWTWVNQGPATVADVTGGLRLYTPTSTSSDWRILTKSSPSAPFTFTVGMLASFFLEANVGAGIALRNSSNGKLVMLTYSHNTGTGFPLAYAARWDSASSFASNIGFYRFLASGQVYLQIEQTTSNRHYRVSLDGTNFILIASTSNTDHMTTDQVCLLLGRSSTAESYVTYIHYSAA